MAEVQEEIRELARDLRHLLLSSHSAGDWLSCSNESVTFFSKRKRTPPQAPPLALPKKVAPPAKMRAPIRKSLPPPPPPQEKEPLKKQRPSMQVRQVPEARDFTSVAKRLQKLFPHLKLIRELPSDADAKAQSMQWKRGTAEVLILLDAQSPQEEEFVKNLGRALHISLKKTRLLWPKDVDKEELNKQYSFVLSSSRSISAHPTIQSLYKEDSQSLNLSPLFIMQEPSHYLQTPQDKAKLWNDLCTKLPR